MEKAAAGQHSQHTCVHNVAGLGVDVRNPLRKLEGVGQRGAAGGQVGRTHSLVERPEVPEANGQQLASSNGEG